MKVLLTGINGQLGKAIINSKPSSISLIRLDRTKLNLSKKEDCYEAILLYKPDWVINCGAYTNVEKAEEEPILASAINHIAPREFSKALLKTGGKLLHISTDYVFDGYKNSPYKTTDTINPLCIYGKSKANGEKEILDLLGSTNQAVIIRTSWLMGVTGNSFLKKMLELHQNNKEIKVIYDQISCPTNPLSLAKLCWKFIQIYSHENRNKKINNKILHWSDSGVASWFDVAIAIGEISKDIGLIKNRAKVIPIQSNEYISKATRPKFSLLDSKVSQQDMNIVPSYWRDSIKSLLKSILLSKKD